MGNHLGPKRGVQTVELAFFFMGDNNRELPHVVLLAIHEFRA